MKYLAGLPRVKCQSFDMCSADLKPFSDDSDMRAKKRTTVITNAEELSDRLANFQCDGLHPHRVLEGSVTRRARIYPPKLCRLIAKAVAALIRRCEREATQEKLTDPSDWLSYPIIEPVEAETG